MNIFALDQSPEKAAQMHLDRHVVKMIIEYAQLLSTAHRLSDGRFEEHISPDGRKKKFYLLQDEKVGLFEKIIRFDNGTTEVVQKLGILNPVCYSLSHQNHPCAVWARTTSTNYSWLYQLFHELSKEYTFRYGKEHKTFKDVGIFLMSLPHKLPMGNLTPFPQAMPDEFKDKDSIRAYKNYYLGSKAKMAIWTKRPVPSWFKQEYPNYDDADFQRTRSVA